MKFLVCSLVLLTLTPAFPGETLRETLGDVLLTDTYSDIDRREALAAARTKDATPDVWWQSGYLRSDDDWIRYEDAAGTVRSGNELDEYYKLKSIARAGSKGHLLLARWCLRNNRMDQYRAHMLAAIRYDSSLLTQRNIRKMGYAQVCLLYTSDAADE